jgi:hypothetical protein
MIKDSVYDCQLNSLRAGKAGIFRISVGHFFSNFARDAETSRQRKALVSQETSAQAETQAG